MSRLTDNEIDFNLTTLKGWSLDDGRIVKQFTFKNFKEAFAAMTTIADIAEKLNHHPHWFNAYNQLNIKLSTEKIGGITMKDFELASRIEEVIEAPKKKRARM